MVNTCSPKRWYHHIYDFDFRPELLSEDQLKLRKILEKNLPLVKTEKINIPWKEIKDVPKTERKHFRNEYIQKLNLQQPINGSR